MPIYPEDPVIVPEETNEPTNTNTPTEINEQTVIEQDSGPMKPVEPEPVT